MSVDLLIYEGSELSNAIDQKWRGTGKYLEFIKSLDTNIISVKYEIFNRITCITFSSESYKNWFILKWS